MFNYNAIDKTPTVFQIKAIIEYMENDTKFKYNFNNMVTFTRLDKNTIIVDLNNAHTGVRYKVVFSENKIITFDELGIWMS